MTVFEEAATAAALAIAKERNKVTGGNEVWPSDEIAALAAVRAVLPVIAQAIRDDSVRWRDNNPVARKQAVAWGYAADFVEGMVG